MKTASTSALLTTAVVLAASMTWTTQAQQAPPPQRITVAVTQVKPDMIGTYQDLIRNEAIPGLKKAGIAWRWTFANGPFGQNNVFYAVTPVTSYAQYDQPNPLQAALGAEGFANYLAKLRPTIVSTYTTLQTLRQDLSIQSFSATPPAFVVVQTLQVAPGKGAEFTKIMTADYLPNYKKAGVTDYWVSALGFGAPGGQISLVRPISKYAELDEPGLLQKAGLTPEAVAEINARRGAITSLIENNVVRLVPTLSFGAPARPRS